MRRTSFAILVLFTSGCVGTFDDTVQPITVYVENSSRDALRFRVSLEGKAPAMVSMPEPTSQPAVEIALRTNVNGDSFELLAEELEFGLSMSKSFPVTSENFVIVNVYANRTMDMWHLDREPRFD